MSEENEQVKTLRLDVFVAGDDREHAKAVRLQLINSVKLYRTVARQVFAVLAMAEIAGAKIEYGDGYLRVMSVKDAAKNIMAKVFDMEGYKGHAYELRELVLRELAPDWYSHVWDGLRRDVSTAWTSKDAELTKVSRGHLILEQRRALAGFYHRGLPVLRTDTVTSNVKYDGNNITLTWDKQIGPVTLRPVGQRSENNRKPKLDASRRHILRQIVEGKWRSCTPRLSEKDGILTLFIPYYAPARVVELDKERSLEVTFSDQPEKFFSCRLHDGRASTADELREDVVGVNAALDWLDALKCQSDKLSAIRRSCGNRYQTKIGSGHQKAFDAAIRRSENISKTRTNGCHTWNHIWTKRLIHRACDWRCGKVIVFDLPSARDEQQEVPQRLSSGLLGRPWAWSAFKAILEYKAKECGIVIEYRDTGSTQTVLLAAGN